MEFSESIYLAPSIAPPPGVKTIKIEDTLPLKEQLKDRLRYLWLADNDGFRVLLEQTPNTNSRRGIVCHTNISGGSDAFMGGELWFGDDGRVFLNFKSGRYDDRAELREDFIKSVNKHFRIKIVVLPGELDI